MVTSEDSSGGGLIGIITASDPSRRNQSLDHFCSALTLEELLRECAALDAFRRTSENLYERVRALFFLYAIHRFHLPPRIKPASGSTHQTTPPHIPYNGYEHLLQRRFEEAIESF